jgi:drug/metabolite transporter (DMT)-like permease
MRLKANLAADGALLATTVLWGSTFVVTKDLLDYWPPLTYLTVRFLIGALLLLAIFPRQALAARRVEWKAGALLGLFIGLGLAIQATGQIYTTPSRAAFITSLTTPLVPFVSLVLLRVRPNIENLIGVTLASVGGFMILAPAEGTINRGDAITLGCVLLFAIHITLFSVYTKRDDIRQVTVLQIVSAAVLFGLIWIAFVVCSHLLPPESLPEFIRRESVPLIWSGRVVGQLFYMATVATIGTFLLWAWGQARMSATHAAIILSLEPVFATLMAVALRGRGEWLGARGAIGASMILAGVLVSELRIGQRRPVYDDPTDDPDISVAD